MTDLNKTADQQAPPTVLAELAAASTPEARFDALVVIVAKLAIDMHTMKGGLAANTSITMSVAESQDQLKTTVEKIDFTMLGDFLEAMGSMKGGIKVLGWLERPAKWVAAMAVAAAAVWKLWEHK